MDQKVVKFNDVDVELVEITRNSGEFVSNETGQQIRYRNYVAKVKINGQIIKFKTERAYSEIMDDLVEEAGQLEDKMPF